MSITRHAAALCVALFALLANLPALAQSNWVTPGGARADGVVMMCLNSSGIAVPVDQNGACPTGSSGGGGAATIANGADVAKGTTTDAPATLPASSTAATEIALQKAIANAINKQSTAATHAQTPALASNLVVASGDHHLISFEASADSTLSGAAWWLLVFDAISLPANGAVTPAKCYAVPSGTTSYSGGFVTPGVDFPTGITMGVSTTGCFTLTASVHAFLAADFN